MIPYEGLLFFYILAAVLVVSAVLGFLGKNQKYWGIIATLFMLSAIFERGQEWMLIGFVVFELIVLYVYFAIRKKSKNCLACWLFVFLSIAPLVFSKLSGILTGNVIGFLGISYLTFKSVQIIIETYDGLIEKVSFADTLYFILFFPTVMLPKLYLIQ